jgi:hypothetical protein
MKIRYIVFVPYLIFIGVMGGNIMAEALIIGFSLGMYDVLFFGNDGGNGGGGGRPA